MAAYRTFRLLEPELCLECRFSRMADVEEADGSVRSTILCTRRDCDNWDISSAEPAKKVTPHDPD